MHVYVSMSVCMQALRTTEASSIPETRATAPRHSDLRIYIYIYIYIYRNVCVQAFRAHPCPNTRAASQRAALSVITLSAVVCMHVYVFGKVHVCICILVCGPHPIREMQLGGLRICEWVCMVTRLS